MCPIDVYVYLVQLIQKRDLVEGGTGGGEGASGFGQDPVHLLSHPENFLKKHFFKFFI